MPDTHAKFHSVDGRRRVLVVEDEEINREILGAILEESYEVVFATDGDEALERVEENKGLLSVILLDLIMPRMPGQEVLRQLKASPETRDIPVIVASADQSQEIQCLDAGATDFIQKPYPDAGVILARVRRTIELSEDRQIIQSTERDPLTGLYNREFFYSYAEQYDQYHRDTPMDAIVIDVNHFATLNERYGRAYADEVLRRIGEKAREMVQDSGGIVCRREADIFQVYCPHREDYKALLDNASQGLAGENNAGNRVRLRMGVYSNADKTIEIERRFDRAKMAADTVRHSFTRNIGVYDDTLRKSELYAEQLIEDFPRAIEEHQFKVYYQPKFDIRPDKPVLNSAEALVRWDHPELGMISPGVFIPLFEENGLIQALDGYVWEEAARQIRDWRDRLGYAVPVSVNVSRVDTRDPNIVYRFLTLLEEHGLVEGDLHLEVTESAYSEDSEQIIDTVKRLRAVGFQIEMDDFGTGYSSLNMLSALPIDALKLDMSFIRTAFSQDRDTHMLEVIVEIADHLGVPVIAEGVETEEQLVALKEIGCDIVQGYYFSPPVPADKFEKFLLERKAESEQPQMEVERPRRRSMDQAAGVIAEEKEKYARRWKKMPNFRLRVASMVFITIAIVAAIALLLSDRITTQGYEHMEQAGRRAIASNQAAYNLEAGSDYLTENVQSFVVTGDLSYLQNYFEEVDVTKRRDKAVDELEQLLEGTESSSYAHLSTALSLSNALEDYEYLAMKLVIEAEGYDESQLPEVLRDMKLDPSMEALSPDEKYERAIDIVFGDDYASYKSKIKSNARQCTEEMITQANAERAEAVATMDVLLAVQAIATIVFLLVIVAMVVFIVIWVRQPLTRMVLLMQAKETVPPGGARELRYVAETYNAIFEENRLTHERLTYGSTHDALTGLFNRTAYDIMRQDIDMTRTGLLVIDVDKFKSINDIYGHDIGDSVLKRVAEVLRYSFRSVDLVFRLGGDEFVVIMAEADSSMGEMVVRRIDQANVMLQKPVGDVPAVSISVGVAFADRKNPDGDIFKDADTALYRVKSSGRCGCEIF